MSAVVTPVPLTSAPQAEWFLARDGQQFGPLSDPELRKLVELGHLKPSDLLWREGFPEWRSARILLSEASAAPKLQPVVAASPSPVAEPVHTPSPAVVPQAPAQTESVAVSHPASSPARIDPPVAEVRAAPLAPAPASVSAPAPAQRTAPPRADPRHVDYPVVAAPTVAQPQATQTYATRANGSTWPTPSPQSSTPQSPTPQAPTPQPTPGPSLTQRAAEAAQSALSRSAPVAAPASQQTYQHPARIDVPRPEMRHQPIGQSRPVAPAPGLQRPMSGVSNHAMAGHAMAGQSMGQPIRHDDAAPLADPRIIDAPRPAPRLGPQSTYARGRPAAPVAAPDFEDDEHDAPRTSVGRWIARIAIVLFFLATLSAAALYAYPHRDSIAAFARNLVPATLIAPPAKSPLTGFSPTTEATDVALQAAPLWRTLKREFPEWYAERVKEASASARDQKSDAQIGDAMMGHVMALRRKHAGDALSSTSARLKSIAVSFSDNLVRLRDTNVNACHGFITAGETHPAYVKVLGEPTHTGPLQAQLASVFEAVAEGRKLPRVYPQPKQADFNTVVSLLQKRGWTDADMRLFSDSGAFGKAEPEKMCRMVIDWFQAQLEISDDDSQIRLLSDALKPVIAG